MVFEYPSAQQRRPLEWSLSSSLQPPCQPPRTRGARSGCREQNTGTRLKHASPALRTGAGSSRARFENQVPPRDCAAVRSTPSCGKSECCAARTHPARSALPLRTSQRQLSCFTPSLSVCFCSQSLRVLGAWLSRRSKIWHLQTCTRGVVDGAPGMSSVLCACARMYVAHVAGYLRDRGAKSAGQGVGRTP